MKLKYNLVQGKLTYDVTELVTAFHFGLTDGVITSVQVVRRRFFYLGDDLVKEDSLPAQVVRLDSLLHEHVLPTALDSAQLLTALLVKVLAHLGDLGEVTNLVLPSLPEDIGNKIAAAHHECEHCEKLAAEYTAKLTEADQQHTFLLEQIRSAQEELVTLQEKARSFGEQFDSAKLQVDAEIQALEAKRNSYTETLTTLENAIQEYSNQSTALQEKVAKLKQE